MASVIIILSLTVAGNAAVFANYEGVGLITLPTNASIYGAKETVPIGQDVDITSG